MNVNPPDRVSIPIPLSDGSPRSCTRSSIWPLELGGTATLWDLDWPCTGPWVARAPLLFWLIDALRPRHIAVVGDAAQPAFLASCQAVGRLGLATRVLGAFVTLPPPDRLEGPLQSERWRRVGAQHRLGAEAAQALLAHDPVDLLVLDASAASLQGTRAPELWRAALTGPRILIVEARAADGPYWSTTLAECACLRVGGPGGAHLALLDGAEGSAVTELQSLLREPEETSRLRHYLERLGAGLAAGQAAREARATAERLEVALAETAARGDAAIADRVAAVNQTARLEADLRTAETNAVTAQQKIAGLEADLRTADTNAVTAQQKIAGLEADLRTAETNAVTAQQKIAGLEADLRTAETNAVTAQQKIAGLEADLRTAETNAVTAQQKIARLEANLRATKTNAFAAEQKMAGLEADLRAAASDLKEARKRSERVEQDLKASISQEEQTNRTLGERLAAVEIRATAAEAWRVAVLASSSWRLTQPLRTLLGNKPRLARLLRRSAKLVWWTVTLQLPARWRLRRRARAEAAATVTIVPTNGFASRVEQNAGR